MASIIPNQMQTMMPMNPAKAKNIEGVKTASKNFEAMYMQEMLSHMWDGVETNGTFGGGRGEEIFRSMLIGQYGKMISDSGQTKIADTLTGSILRMQEEQHNPRGVPLSKPIQNTGESHE